MTIKEFLEKLNTSADTIDFADTIDVVESNYMFVETAFENGTLKNNAGENSGSCKLFAFAKIQNLSKDQTLQCFGNYYRNDVLNDPTGSGHQNIRNFMKTAWEGVIFEGEALRKK